MTHTVDLDSTPLEHRTLLSVVERALGAVPDKVALFDDNMSLTYAALWESARRLAGGFKALGVERGDRVVLFLDNHVDGVTTWLALALIGAVEVPINTSYLGEMLSYVVNDSGAKVAVVDASLLSKVTDIAPSLEQVATVVVRAASSAPALSASGGREIRVVPFGELEAHSPAAPEKAAPWDLAAVVYTSGTTGRSKGVLAPHAHAWNHAAAVGSTDTDDLRFVVLPQFHIAGQWGGVYRSLIGQATAFVASGFHVSTFWDEIAGLGATTTQLVGTMASFLTRAEPSPADAHNSLREIHMIPVVPDVAGFAERFGVHVVTGFGNTEVGTVLMNPDAVKNPGVGVVRFGYEARLVDEFDIEVPRGRPGELVIRARVPWTTMTGYQGESQKTVDAYRNGWLHSGDGLVQDEDGSYHFVDRMDDAIRRRGENVSSLEVEIHLNQHPAVLESAAVAVPSEHLEDEIKAVVVLSVAGAASEEDLFNFMADRLPYFMVPRFFEIVSELPKTPTAKVRKNELRSLDTTGLWDSKAAGLVVTRTARTGAASQS
jgi:crotonobetaine/carnitine-CoA ligase